MKKIFLFLKTIKYLKWTQIYNRVKRNFFKPPKKFFYNKKDFFKASKYININLYDEKIDADFNCSFLNYKKKLELPKDWNNKELSKLWLYNLHYFDDLLSNNSNKKRKFHINLLSIWINQNPIGEGVGWEPYPISIRLCNIIKAWHAGLDLESHHFESLYFQASYLYSSVEKHLLGNHYFANLKALLFAGIVFDNKKWINYSNNGLIQEIPEQILDDGANFELSPMYHALMLVDMLDIYNLIKAVDDSRFECIKRLIEVKLPKMIIFLEMIYHNDGDVSFFNDSTKGVAPNKNLIIKYAKMLGFETSNTKKNEELCHFEDSGYMVSNYSGNKLIFDAGNVGPDYIPGHAHADTLSFEFSIAKNRVFVNSGISQYGNDKLRILQRKTSSHNTVEIDKKDSSEVWSSFRVANRARTFNQKFEIKNNRVILSAEHDGYSNLLKNNNHLRILELSESSLKVKDFIYGNYKKAIARFYFHPDFSLSIDGNNCSIMSKNIRMFCKIDSLKVKVADALWFPSFGTSIKNQCLELEIIDNKSEIIFSWEA